MVVIGMGDTISLTMRATAVDVVVVSMNPIRVTQASTVAPTITAAAAFPSTMEMMRALVAGYAPGWSVRCVFRGSWPPIPAESGHPFRLNLATYRVRG